MVIDFPTAGRNGERTILKRLRKLRTWSVSDRWLLAQALVLLPLTFCGIYVFGIRRWQEILRTFVPLRSQKNSTPDPGRADRIAEIVTIAAHLGVYQASCLPRALVLWSLLRRNEIESAIRIGAQKERGQLAAHAWVEYLGIALNEKDGQVQQFSLLQ